MDITAQVTIQCTSFELRLFKPFLAASHFSMYNSIITIQCTDTGQQIQVICSARDANCWGWRHFKAEWERRFGVIK